MHHFLKTSYFCTTLAQQGKSQSSINLKVTDVRVFYDEIKMTFD